jgi:hypothetical protein
VVRPQFVSFERLSEMPSAPGKPTLCPYRP